MGLVYFQLLLFLMRDGARLNYQVLQNPPAKFSLPTDVRVGDATIELLALAKRINGSIFRLSNYFGDMHSFASGRMFNTLDMRKPYAFLCYFKSQSNCCCPSPLLAQWGSDPMVYPSSCLADVLMIKRLTLGHFLLAFPSWSGIKKGHPVVRGLFLSFYITVTCSSSGSWFALFLSVLFWFFALITRFVSSSSCNSWSFFSHSNI